MTRLESEFYNRQAEGNAGKKTIIIDFKSEEGKKISHDLIKRADIVLLNKADEQVTNMALDRESLDRINAKAIHLNVQARKGENLYSESANWPGYDPALQVYIQFIKAIIKNLLLEGGHYDGKCVLIYVVIFALF